MANTYTQILLHVVFAVKYRESRIKEENREELQKYITGIIQNRGHKLLAIYCMPDHIHILIGYKPRDSFSELMRDIKAGSSKFINDKRWFKSKFNWQEGYGTFSVSQSALEIVVNYILNQKERHAKQSFRDEYYLMLQDAEIEYDEQYLFDWLN
jgi:REP element-mobilizing transposase RayT